jgi:hypothetical protein
MLVNEQKWTKRMSGHQTKDFISMTAENAKRELSIPELTSLVINVLSLLIEFEKLFYLVVE